MNVLVTGVGGGVGQSIIKSLKNTSYTVIGVDGEDLGTGLYAVVRGYKGYYANHPKYIEHILEICRAEQCALLFPGLDAELPILASEAQQFRDAGTLPVVSSPEVVAICDEKLATSDFLVRHGFPVPHTVVFDEKTRGVLEYPFFIKPRRGGARSIGVLLVRDDRDFDYNLARIPAGTYVAQEEIVGAEYTCGSVNRDGKCFGVIVMRRILRDGDTYKAFVEDNPALQSFVRDVLEALGPFGPCNVQLRVKDNRPYIFEFNARCSGTTHCRTLAGFNEPLMTAELLLNGKLPQPRTRCVSILRYWQELVVDNNALAVLAREGCSQDQQGTL